MKILALILMLSPGEFTVKHEWTFNTMTECQEYLAVRVAELPHGFLVCIPKEELERIMAAVFGRAA